MVNFIAGELWDEVQRADIIFVTTNAVVANAQLVMGVGSAQEAKERYPHLPSYFGKYLSTRNLAMRRFGIIIADEITSNPVIGLFQTKLHYKDSSKLDIIAFSAGMLAYFAWVNPQLRIAMPFPGVGNEKLHPSDIHQVIECLPNNIYVYSKPFLQRRLR